MEKRVIKQDNSPTKPLPDPWRLNDIGFRLILIPFFGIAIPLVTGMMNNNSFSNFQIKLSFLYTILIAFVIWQGNRYLLFTLRAYFDWFKKPIRKIAVLLVAITFYTIPISALLLIGWYHLFAKGIINWQIVYSSTLVIMICVVFIVHVYETVFLVKESESEMVRNEQLERAKAEAELEALKNQIDPHFIFNSLNTLSHLIDQTPAKARQFNDNLADVYRYILQNKAKSLVLLREEILFLSDYFSLLKIRFEQAVSMEIQIEPSAFDQYLIPPISLQMLVENAIKHNEFSDNNPICIVLRLGEDELIITNNINPKESRRTSSRIGLRNLEERYRLITGKSITVFGGEEKFVVHLPVLNAG
jgi:sensor histidine kinase YesM